ncbi:hypothetical protein K3M98_07115 [Streptococcus dysgalactiae subsp. dysgalactiae]|nr:hypothetical protein [Streptococcus dysgalactiae subsp. dysgalactiae]MCB2831959.1 hypothetical protein [Streptococcus dysgalactiae subsp. dysgalactiae]MCB2835574.1 hypothetical protein [Streptococcus dysgalactiae subsp. dysgalactiae]MCB2839649.1 hypothetical protein [Streptococcus dysgalactiae subsp. dysgalactiae]MCB2843837.1 hypothetical protein [Streptococcus dysgalactiae subsp. dysgalactiae]
MFSCVCRQPYCDWSRHFLFDLDQTITAVYDSKLFRRSWFDGQLFGLAKSTGNCS